MDWDAFVPGTGPYTKTGEDDPEIDDNDDFDDEDDDDYEDDEESE